MFISKKKFKEMESRLSKIESEYIPNDLRFNMYTIGTVTLKEIVRQVDKNTLALKKISEI